MITNVWRTVILPSIGYFVDGGSAWCHNPKDHNTSWFICKDKTDSNGIYCIIPAVSSGHHNTIWIAVFYMWLTLAANGSGIPPQKPEILVDLWIGSH
jgi:hypothetical protein